MIDKIVDTVAEAVAGIPDGGTVVLSGFGGAGMPVSLIDGLIAQGARELTIVNNNAGNGRIGIAVYRKHPNVVYVSIEQGSRYNPSTAYINRAAGLYGMDDVLA